MSGAICILVGGTLPLSANIGAGAAIVDTLANYNFGTNTVTAQGGTPPYTYLWSWTGASGSGTMTFNGSNTTATVTPRVAGAVVGTITSGNLQCQVTDAASRVITTSTSYYEYERI